MDSEKRNNDFGDMDSAFPRLMFFWRDSEFCPQGVWGGMGAGYFMSILSFDNILKMVLLTHTYDPRRPSEKDRRNIQRSD